MGALGAVATPPLLNLSSNYVITMQHYLYKFVNDEDILITLLIAQRMHDNFAILTTLYVSISL